MINGWIVLGISALMFFSGWALGFAFGMNEGGDWDD